MTFQDLRFKQTPGLLTRIVNVVRRLFGRPPSESSKILAAEVELDRNLHLVGDVYGSDEKRVVVPEPH